MRFWPLLSFILFAASAFATEKVYIFTVDYGPMSSIYSGVRFHLDPEIKDTARFTWSRSDFSNAARFADILDTVQSRGYEVIAQVAPPPAAFLKALEDKDTVLLIHEGHGVINREANVVAFEIGDTVLAGDEIESYLKRTGKKQIVPSKKLKAVYTQACYGGRCETYYRTRLNIPEKVNWIGLYETVHHANTPRLLEQLERSILPLLPDLKRPSCVLRLFQGAMN